MPDSLRFHGADFADDLPVPGFYPGTLTSARFRPSAQGNHMLQVAITLQEVAPAYEQLADYFVLEGASPRGVATARRRLLELYRACGHYPQQGDPITPAHLLEVPIEVEVDHDHWKGQPRLRVLGYRRPAQGLLSLEG